MRAAFGAASQRSTEQVAALKLQTDAVRSLTRAHNEERTRLASLRSALLSHGVLLKGGATATEQISRRAAAYNTQLAEQQRRLAAVNNAQQKYNAAKETREKLQGAGITGMVTGAAIATPAIAALKSYADIEDAMKDVAKQVNGLRDNNGNRTAQFYEMQQAIKASAQQLPLPGGAVDYAALVAGGARMGVANGDDPWEKQKSDLLKFATTAAMAAKAFELPADQLSENLGKIAGLYKVPTQNIEDLGDAINYLDDNAKSKGSDIIDVLQRVGGLADKLDYRKAAALGSTFLTLGAAPEIAASATNAMVRELSIATTQSDNFMQGLNALGLSAEKIQKNMPVDAMGTIITVLEKAKNLAPDQQTSVLTQIFGKEFGDDAQKLANNLPELYRQLELVNGAASKGSMRRESDIDKDSVSAQWLLLKANAENAFSSMGETLRAPALQIMKFADGIIQRFRAWTEANPALVGALMKIAVAGGAIIAVLGALALAASTILLPMAAMRLSLSLLTGGRGLAGLIPSVSGLTSRLSGLVPSLASTGKSIRDWIPLFRSASAAAGSLGARITTFGSGIARALMNPLGTLGTLGNGLRTLATSGFGSLLTAGRTVMTVIGGGLSVLLSPIGLIVAALAGAALLVWKYWQPISAFFSGFFQGVIAGLEPVKAAFAPLAPIFDGIGNAISRVWQWFTDLFEPVSSSAETLKECTEAGRVFGEVVGAAVSGVLSVIMKVAEGIGWLLKKLGAIPEAANAAQEVANTMDAVAPQKKAPVMYVWDPKQKKMVPQVWTPEAAGSIKKAADSAPKPAPAVPTPPPTAAHASTADLSGFNAGKKKKGGDGSSAKTASDKPGDIVFKKHPPIMPIMGAWQEPQLVASSAAIRPGMRAAQMLRSVSDSVAPWFGRSASVPVPVGPESRTRPVPATDAPAGDRYHIEINIYDSAKSSAKEIAAAVRREIEAFERQRNTRNRARFSDSA